MYRTVTADQVTVKPNFMPGGRPPRKATFWSTRGIPAGRYRPVAPGADHHATQRGGNRRPQQAWSRRQPVPRLASAEYASGVPLPTASDYDRPLPDDLDPAAAVRNRRSHLLARQSRQQRVLNYEAAALRVLHPTTRSSCLFHAGFLRREFVYRTAELTGQRPCRPSPSRSDPARSSSASRPRIARTNIARAACAETPVRHAMKQAIQRRSPDKSGSIN